MSFLHLLIPLKHRFYFVTSPLKSSQCLPLPRERSPNPQHRGTLAQDPLRLFAHCSFPLWPAVITCISLLTSRCQTVAIFLSAKHFHFSTPLLAQFPLPLMPSSLSPTPISILYISFNTSSNIPSSRKPSRLLQTKQVLPSSLLPKCISLLQLLWSLFTTVTVSLV